MPSSRALNDRTAGHKGCAAHGGALKYESSLRESLCTVLSRCEGLREACAKEAEVTRAEVSGIPQTGAEELDVRRKSDWV